MPTVPVAYEASARNTYEARVRRALVALGSKDPDADIKATHAYMKHCKSLKLDPAVTSAGIYTTVHHRHEPMSVLRGAREEAAKSGLMQPNAVETARAYFKQYERELVDHPGSLHSHDLKGYIRASLMRKDGSIPSWLEARAIIEGVDKGEASEAGGYKPYDAITPEGAARKVQFWAQRHGYEMLGYPVPLDHGLWSVGVQFPDGSKQIVTVPNKDVEKLWTAHGANESPTGGEWEVTIRRQGTIEKLVQAAGRKPDEIIGQNVMFGDFYDDEKAQAFAHKMMKAGYFSMFGPRPKPVAASGATEAPRKKRGVARDSAPCNRLERGGVKGDCSALAKEIGPIETDKDLYRLFAPRMRKEPQEVFYVACVDVHGNLCAFSEIARGQVSSVHVTAAQVTQFVLSCKPMPTAYAVSHCHPGGHARPSEADKKLTEDIRKSGREAMREVVFMDHIIVAGGENNREYYSFTDGKVKVFK